MSTSIHSLLEFTRQVYSIEKNLKPTTKTDYDIQVQLFERATRDRLAKLAAENGETFDHERPTTLADLTDENLAYAMAWQRQRDRQAGTSNKLYRTLKAIWRLASERGCLTAPTRIKRYREPKRVSRAWSVAEMELIVAAAERAPGRIGEVPAISLVFVHLRDRRQANGNDETADAPLLSAKLRGALAVRASKAKRQPTPPRSRSGRRVAAAVRSAGSRGSLAIGRWVGTLSTSGCAT